MFCAMLVIYDTRANVHMQILNYVTQMMNKIKRQIRK